jgi:hypothetical protein
MLHEISPCVMSVSVMTSLVMTLLVIDFAPNYSETLLTTYLAGHLVIHLPYHFACAGNTFACYYG